MALKRLINPTLHSGKTNCNINHTFERGIEVNNTMREVVAVLFSHIERNPVSAIKPNIMVLGFLPMYSTNFRATFL